MDQSTPAMLEELVTRYQALAIDKSHALARAEAAEAEVARLREALERICAYGDYYSIRTADRALYPPVE